MGGVKVDWFRIHSIFIIVMEKMACFFFGFFYIEFFIMCDICRYIKKYETTRFLVIKSRRH